MPDIIVPLFEVPDVQPLLARLQSEGITVRRALPWERAAMCAFIGEHFGQGWVDETLTTFARQPITSVIALDGPNIIGFAAFEASARGYFGPTGVLEAYRGRSIGKALYLASLNGLRELGYAYAIVGSPGPVDFYLKASPGLLLPAEWKTFHSH